MLSVQPGLRGSNDLRVGQIMATFQLFFQSREQVVFRRVQIRRIGWVIKTLEAQVGQFLLGCKGTVSRRIVMQEQDPLGELTAAFFLQNVLQLHQQKWVQLRVDSSARWKIINEEDAVLIPKNPEEKFSSGSLHSEFFWAGWGEPLSRHSIDCCFVSGSKWYNQLSSMVTKCARQEIIWIAPNEKIPKLAQTTGTVDVFDPLSGISGPTSRRASACLNLHEWWTNPLTWDTQLLSYWFSRNLAVFQD